MLFSPKMIANQNVMLIVIVTRLTLGLFLLLKKGERRKKRRGGRRGGIRKDAGGRREPDRDGQRGGKASQEGEMIGGTWRSRHWSEGEKTWGRRVGSGTLPVDSGIFLFPVLPCQPMTAPSFQLVRTKPWAFLIFFINTHTHPTNLRTPCPV